MLFVVLGLLATANWSTFTTPTELNLLVTRVQAPLGLLMLITIGVMGALYSILLLVGERRLLRENAKNSRELAVLRKEGLDSLTEQLQEVRTAVTRELAVVRELHTQGLTQLGDLRSRVDRETARHTDSGSHNDPAGD